jgi:hypothetical protein
VALRNSDLTYRELLLLADVNSNDEANNDNVGFRWSTRAIGVDHYFIREDRDFRDFSLPSFSSFSSHLARVNPSISDRD